MRVLHVVPWYEPAWGCGGTATAVSMLCRALATVGIRVTVYTTSDAGEGSYLDVPLCKPVQVGGVEVWYFPPDFLWSKKRSFASSRLTRKLRMEIGKFDLVHVSSTRHMYEIMVYWLAKRLGKKYLISPHASLMEWSIRGIGKRIPKLFYIHSIGRFVLQGASALHFLCEGEREASQRYTMRIPSFVVPNGVDVDRFARSMEKRQALRDVHGVPRDAVVLLYLGRIHPLKNLEVVVRALRLLDANCYFFIAGPVSDESYRRKLQSEIVVHGLADRVKILPPVPYGQVVDWHSMADLLVLPSKVEGISMSTIEALASGLPVLVSRNVANWRELVADRAGLVVDPEVGSVVEALRCFLSGPTIVTQLSRNAVASAKRRYDIRRVAALMAQAYHDVLSGNQSPELQWQVATSPPASLSGDPIAQ